MLRTTSRFVASKSVSTGQGYIKEVGSGIVVGHGNVDDEANMIDNTRFLASGTGFFTSKARLTLAKLRQTFSTPPILYHFDLEYHIRIESNTSSYTIGTIFSQLTSDSLSL